ncbi:MAG: hypothetical protein ACFFFC_00260 [Candidatus Thorarchaeota archaeon]
MKNLPKPSFVIDTTSNTIKYNGEDIKNTTKENVEKAVVLGKLIWDSNLAHVRSIKNEDDLLYHIFRGPAIPERFWGTGYFGLCVLTAAEAAWKFDKPRVEFIRECCRQEVYADDHTTPMFPPSYYSSYLCIIPIRQKLSVPKEQIESLCEILERNLEEAISNWSNGN